MSNPTADWEKVGDRYYRKIKLYDAIFDQDLELEKYVIASAPYAGAIGISLFLTRLVLGADCQSFIPRRGKASHVSWTKCFQISCRRL